MGSTQAVAANSSALSVNNGVVPVLNITDDIAYAAALVAEADSVGSNATIAKRATTGTY